GGDIGYRDVNDDSAATVQQNIGGPSVKISAETYTARYLYFTASVGYHLEHMWSTDGNGTINLHEPSIAAGIGVRFGDVRLVAVAGTAFDTFDGNDDFLTHVGLRAHAVIRRRIEIDGGAAVLFPVNGEIGESVDASAMFWVGHRVGLGVGGFYRHGTLAPLNGENDSIYGGALSAKFWVWPRAAFTVGYSLRFETSVSDDSDESRTDHEVTLGLTFRP
ncbi:MAG TPA: hypothetical protein VIA18_31940, partial [Polyangia bacterium]|nr:hypothetical protein [Polyangia bacterium]